MNEIGLSSRLPSPGATQAYTPPRVGSESERTTAASSVTTPSPNSGSTSMSSTSPTQTIGSLTDTVSISSDAYRAPQTGLSTASVDSTADGSLNADQAKALLQTIQNGIANDPQMALRVQADQVSASNVSRVLAA